MRLRARHFVLPVLLLLAAADPGSGQKPTVKVLLVGDSLSVGPFGLGLDAKLSALPNVKVARYSSCGSSPISWINGINTYCGYYYRGFTGGASSGTTTATPVLSNLMATQQPNLVIIQLGTNLIQASLSTSSATARDLAKVVLQAKAQCVWVGPPKTCAKMPFPMSDLVKTLREATQDQCLKFIDSTALTDAPKYDKNCLHFAPSEVQKWVDGVAAEIGDML